MRILWAVSSVGKGHVMRDIAIVRQFQKMATVEVDWLAPEPAGDFLRDRGYNVLPCSTQLAGSGKVYQQVFRECLDEFNLMDYIRADNKLHRHDFDVSRQAWSNNAYDVIIGDEAFWLLGGFGSNPSSKPAPFVFLTDFIGVKAMRPRVKDMVTAWNNNAQFMMSYFGPDVYIYIGAAEEIPVERFGFLLPSRRKWAEQHCRFVKPIVNFEPDISVDKKALRHQLGLPEKNQIFLAVVGPEGNHAYRTEQLENTFELLKQDFPNAHFILVGPALSTKKWIQHHRYVNNLYEHFAVSDCVIVQSGYGKIVELAALGIPFIAIPLDYHFEQEYVMAHRLRHYGVGKLLTLRDCTPNDIAYEVKAALEKPLHRVPADSGAEVARIILDAAQESSPA